MSVEFLKIDGESINTCPHDDRAAYIIVTLLSNQRPIPFPFDSKIAGELLCKSTKM